MNTEQQVSDVRLTLSRGTVDHALRALTFVLRDCRSTDTRRRYGAALRELGDAAGVGERGRDV